MECNKLPRYWTYFWGGGRFSKMYYPQNAGQSVRTNYKQYIECVGIIDCEMAWTISTCKIDANNSPDALKHVHDLLRTNRENSWFWTDFVSDFVKSTLPAFPFDSKPLICLCQPLKRSCLGLPFKFLFYDNVPTYEFGRKIDRRERYICNNTGDFDVSATRIRCNMSPTRSRPTIKGNSLNFLLARAILGSSQSKPTYVLHNILWVDWMQQHYGQIFVQGAFFEHVCFPEVLTK